MNGTTVPSTPGISVEIVQVTPELAQKWLGLNTSNRKLKPRQVIAFANDMRGGRWRAVSVRTGKLLPALLGLLCFGLAGLNLAMILGAFK